MIAAPASHQERVRAYYQETTESSYLHWAGDALALHLGLSDGAETSLQQGLINMNAFLADRAGVGPGTRVLDAGTGVGGSAIWLCNERRAEVVGVTLDPGQVELARRFAGSAGPRASPSR